MDIDVTDRVRFDLDNDEALPLRQCVCGAPFSAWTRTIGFYRDWADRCLHCGARLYFTVAIRVFEVIGNAKT